MVVVCKKNFPWHMWVDYRNLNKTTIKDDFPIYGIDESLNELHGTIFFTKLDLRSVDFS
jgi:hypothetical protein